MFHTAIAATFGNNVSAMLDRFSTEDHFWRLNPHLQQTIEGHRHLLVRRGDKLKPVPLLELTEADFSSLAQRVA